MQIARTLHIDRTTTHKKQDPCLCVGRKVSKGLSVRATMPHLDLVRSRLMRLEHEVASQISRIWCHPPDTKLRSVLLFGGRLSSLSCVFLPPSLPPSLSSSRVLEHNAVVANNNSSTTHITTHHAHPNSHPHTLQHTETMTRTIEHTSHMPAPTHTDTHGHRHGGCQEGAERACGEDFCS